MAVAQRFRAKQGDRIEVAGHRTTEKPRVGSIVEVLGAPGHEHYRVRWEDGRESAAFFPGSDATIKHARRTR